MDLTDLQRMLRTLADPIRLRILHLLFAEQSTEWDVSALVSVLDLPQPTVSRHLAKLRADILVEFLQVGKRRIYRLADDQSRLDQSLLGALESFVASCPEVREDLRRASERVDAEPAGDELTVVDIYATKWLLESSDDSSPGQDEVFRALANPTRRRLLDEIQRHPGVTLHEVSEAVHASRQAVRKHIDVLSDAEMVHMMEDGRSRRLYYNAVPLQRLYDRWTDAESASRARAVLAVKGAVESQEDRNG